MAALLDTTNPEALPWAFALAAITGSSVAPSAEAANLAALFRADFKDVFTPGAVASRPAGARAANLDVVAAWIVAAAYEDKPATVEFELTTHPAQGWDFHGLAFAWAPTLERIGIPAELRLVEAGFGKAAGKITASAFPSPRLSGLDLPQRGILVETHASVFVAGLPAQLAVAARDGVGRMLRGAGIPAMVELLPVPASSRGIVFGVRAQFEHSAAFFGTRVESADPPEEAIQALSSRFTTFLERRGAFDGDTAARLIVPLGLAASRWSAPHSLAPPAPARSFLSTTEVTPLQLELAALTRLALDVEIRIVGLPGEPGTIEIRPRDPAPLAVP